MASTGNDRTPAPPASIQADGPPLPTGQIMNQWWRDITFLHWRVDPDLVAPLLPRGVRPDRYDGSAWVGLIPFRMVDAGLGRLGPVPRLGTFLETNVRVYSVDDQGRRGVVFASLDADRLAVVAAANLSFGVPYKPARIRFEPTRLTDDALTDPTDTDPTGPGDLAGRRLVVTTERRSGSRPRSRMEIEVGGRVAHPSSLDHFLTARFGLHTRALGRTWWVPNTHAPWPLRHARLLSLHDELVTAAGLPGVTTSAPDSVLFSTGIRTVFGRPQPLREPL